MVNPWVAPGRRRACRPPPLYGRVAAALAVLAIAIGQQASSALAQDAPAPNIETETIHWAYSSFLGTGYYRVSGERQVYVLDMPFGFDWRAPRLEADGRRTPGVRFDLPVTLGLHRIDPFDDFLDLDNLGTVSFTPGVEIDYPLSERWLVRGYGNIGWGTEVSGDEQAWIWHVGLKTRYAFRHESLDWGVLGEVFHAGYRPRGDSSDGLGGFGLGVDAQHPIGWRAPGGRALDVAWDLSYRWYGDALTFRSARGPDRRIDDEWRFNLGLVLRDRPLAFWFWTFDRFSMGYRFSSGGEFRGVTFSLSAPLDR